MAWNGQVPHVRVSRGSARPTKEGQRQLLPPQAIPSADPPPQVSRAQLPATYQEAQKAITQCARIDECKDWSDKASALASYARQAKDHTLRLMAERIQARAVRRCGELLKQVPSGQGSRNQHGEVRGGAVTRQKAALDAGMSERQKVTALRVAAPPAPTFESLVEDASPATVTQLAQLGRQTRGSPIARNMESVRAAEARKLFGSFQEFCELNDPAELAKELQGQDVESLRKLVALVRTWIEGFEENLP